MLWNERHTRGSQEETRVSVFHSSEEFGLADSIGGNGPVMGERYLCWLGATGRGVDGVVDHIGSALDADAAAAGRVIVMPLLCCSRVRPLGDVVNAPETFSNTAVNGFWEHLAARQKRGHKRIHDSTCAALQRKTSMTIWHPDLPQRTIAIPIQAQLLIIPLATMHDTLSTKLLELDYDWRTSLTLCLYF
jgi:hypothetical protein